MNITNEYDSYWKLEKGDMILLNPDNEIVEFVEYVYDGAFMYKEIKSGKTKAAHRDDFKQKINYNV